MKCKNCGKELTGKKEFCDDNKGKCYREYKKKQSFVFNEGKEIPQMTCRSFVVNSEYDNLQLTLTQLKEENNQIKQSSESLIESFDEKLLAMTKGNVELRRKLKREKGIQFELEANWLELFNNLIHEDKNEIISLATSQLDSRENDYPKTQEYILWEVKIPKILIERGMFIKQLEQPIKSNKTKTKESDEITRLHSAISTLSEFHTDIHAKIRTNKDKMCNEEKQLRIIDHMLGVPSYTSDEELLRLSKDRRLTLNKRTGYKHLSLLLDVVKDITIPKEWIPISNYGNSYTLETDPTITFTSSHTVTEVYNMIADTKVKFEKTDECSEYIEELHKSSMGKLLTTYSIREFDLEDIKSKVEKHPMAGGFRVIKNVLNVYK